MIFFKLLFVFILVLPVEAQTLKSLGDFQKQTKTLQRTGLSLYQSGNYIGEFISYMEGNELVSVDNKSFDKLMKQLLVQEKYEEYKRQFNNKSILTKDDLTQFGFSLSLEVTSFRLNIQTPELFLNPTPVSLNDLTKNQNQLDVESAFTSGFINYSFNQELKVIQNQNKQDNLYGNVLANLNINSFNLETNYILEPEMGWSRVSSVLSKDLKEPMVRLSAGDLSYTPQTFQSSYQFLGARVARSFEISPQSMVTSKAEKEIFLTTPSTVEIFINGFLIQTLNLEAGKHRLEDIPIIQGINHVVFRISDSSGKKEYIVFQHTGSESMLKKGFHEFEYNAGALSKTSNSKIDYTNELAGSFFHRYGVTSVWSTGIFGEFKKGFINGGPENQVATGRGLFVHNLAFSKGENETQGTATKLSYYWTCPCGDDNQVKRLSCSYEYRSANYLNNVFSETYNRDELRHALSISYSQKLTETIAGVASGNVSSLDFKTLNQKQYSLSLNKNFKNNIFLTSTFQHTEQGKNSKSIESVLLQLSYNFDEGKRNLITTVSQVDKSRSGQLEYTYNKNKPMNNSIYKARLSETDQNRSGGISAYYNSQYIEFLGAMDYQGEGGGMNRTQTYSLNPSGSVAFADNKWGFGQKIQRAFILLDNQLKEPLIVNGDEENYEAYVKPRTSVVLTSVQPYVTKSVNVISDDNSSLGLSNKDYKVETNNKSGASLVIGNSNAKRIEGVLVNKDGLPYSFVGGRMINLSSGVEIPFFTAKNGKFYLENILPEPYQLIIYSKNTVHTFQLNLKDQLSMDRNDLGKIIMKE